MSVHYTVYTYEYFAFKMSELYAVLYVKKIFKKNS